MIQRSLGLTSLLLLGSTAVVTVAGCAKDHAPTGPTKPDASTRTIGIPTGWGGGQTTSFAIGIEAASVHGGYWAAYLTNPETIVPPGGYAVMTQLVQADVYRGHRVRWSGWVRPTNVIAAESGLWMRVDGPGVVQGFDNMDSRRVVGTGDWRQVSVVLDVPPDAIGIAVGALFTGTGELLVDDLALDIVPVSIATTNSLSGTQSEPYDSATIVAQYARIPAAPENLDFEGVRAAPAPATATVSWLSQAAVPLSTVQPGRDVTDLAPLTGMIGSAHLFGMGEATHGTHEFFLMKSRVFQFLVSKLGFTHFAIEATWAESNDVNTYVLTGQGDPAHLLSHLYFWTWNTQEVLDLIQWMRQWNTTAAPNHRVQFLGFDMQYPGAAMDTVAHFIGRVDAPNVSYVASRYLCLNPYRDYNGGFAVSPSAYAVVPQATRTACHAGLQDVYNLLNTDSTAYLAASSPAIYANALHSARLVQQFEDFAAAGATSAIRDRYMAENIQWLKQQARPDSRMMLWAHDYHISAVPGAMGSYLRAAYGDDYVNLGFLFGRGGFNAIPATGIGYAGLRSWDAELVPNGSLEAVFVATGQPRLLFDARRIAAAGPVAAPLAGPLAMRTIGSIYDPALEASYFGIQIFPGDFQLLIFIGSTTPSALLPFVP
jgi:erythromycin esterase